MGLVNSLLTLLGVSAYKPAALLPGPSEETVREMRELVGGNIAPPPITQTRWYLEDVEAAIRSADYGDMARAARLHRSMRSMGTIAGLLSTRSMGLVRLPKRFYGSPEQIRELEPRNGSRSVFDEMFPQSELALLNADGIVLGVGVAELVPVEGRDYPVMVRLDPEWLRYRWNDGTWYYNSVAGPIPITPGDGRWILHVPGGRISPWQSGLFSALGNAYVSKTHAKFYRDNYVAKLANAARVAVAPQGASEKQKQSWFRSVMAWGVNTVFGMTPGYDVKLLESNGRGYESFAQTIADADNEIMIALAGQVVTTTGGVGFANADIFKSIRADLIKSDGDSLAYTLNTQGIPPWVLQRWGVDALRERAIVEWDVEPARDRNAEAQTMVTTANAVKMLREALAPYGRDVDITAISNRFGIPIAGDLDGDGTPDATAEETVDEI